jgi:hypothetical protein
MPLFWLNQNKNPPFLVEECLLYPNINQEKATADTDSQLICDCIIHAKPNGVSRKIHTTVATEKTMYKIVFMTH